MIQGVLLDFYGTVVEDDDDVIHSIAEEIAADVPGFDAREIGSLWGREFAVGTRATTTIGFRPQREIVLTALADVLTSVGSSLSAETLCERQFAYWRTPGLRVGSAEFLEQCGVPVCIISNIDRADLDAAIDHHGLHVAHRITSEDVRTYKPHSAIFAAGLDALGLSPDEVLHVGDSLTADVAGANAVGIPVAWVNRRGRSAPADTRIDHEIGDLCELLPLLRTADL